MLSSETNIALYGRPLVKPSNIESELDKIRNAAAVQDAARDQASGGGPAPRARATLSNCIILNAKAPGKESDLAIDALMNELCIAYPSRFFVVDCNLPSNAQSSGIATAVSSRCFLAESGTHVCSEEVYISVEQRSIPLVQNLLVSLFAADVDIVVLVAGDPVGGAGANEGLAPLLSALLPISDRVIYDSAQFADYRTSLGVLAGAAGPSAQSLGDDKLYDVTWQRIKRWRSLIAEGFDAERLTTLADSISRITLRCQSSADAIRKGALPGDALLLAGWILGSIGCEVNRGSASQTISGFSIDCSAGKGKLTVEFVGAPLATWGEEKSTVSQVEILAETNECVARLNLERQVERGNAEISTGVTSREGCGSSCEFAARNAPFISQGFEDLVLANVISRRGDRSYFWALALSQKLAEASRMKAAA